MKHLATKRRHKQKEGDNRMNDQKIGYTKRVAEYDRKLKIAKKGAAA